MKHNHKDMPVLMANLGAVHMNISGNREIVLEGGKSVVEYSDASIKINTGKYIIGFSGRNLQIRCMTEYGIVIHGFITSIEYIM